jgi:hypothetical protein
MELLLIRPAAAVTAGTSGTLDPERPSTAGECLAEISGRAKTVCLQVVARARDHLQANRVVALWGPSAPAIAGPRPQDGSAGCAGEGRCP